jgi:hypothetical protein
LEKGKQMPRAFLAIFVLAVVWTASVSTVMARDYSSCLRRVCAHHGYAPYSAPIPDPNGGYYYNGGYDPYENWAIVRLLKAGIPGSPFAGGGPTGAGQATNRPGASKEIGAAAN